MWKVFLAEDERVVREGLRDNIPWEGKRETGSWRLQGSGGQNRIC